jgi:PilZ domain-containing protein
MTHIDYERRAGARRYCGGRRGRPQVRIRPGHEVTLIDVSAGGALVETSRRLLPNAFAEVYVEHASHRASVRGRVLRCTIVGITPAAVRYRAAIQFDAYLPWFVEDDQPFGMTDIAAHTKRAQATPEVR